MGGDWPSLVWDKPGEINRLGLDVEAALSLIPQDAAEVYEVFSHDMFFCLPGYSSRIVSSCIGHENMANGPHAMWHRALCTTGYTDTFEFQRKNFHPFNGTRDPCVDVPK